MTQRSFGQMVREARLERHLSMGQLAAAVDRSTASVRRWERDEGLPSEDAIETLILRLGLDRADVENALAEHRGDDPEAAVIGEGDPIDVVPLADVAVAVGAGAVVDWQPPEVAEPSEPQPTPAQPRTAPPAPIWPTASVPVEVVTQDQTLLQTIRDPDRPWLGYIRAVLTIAVLAGLAWILVWAIPEFLDAFGEVWDSLWQQEGA
ncbi:MAG: helix-turn-helix transcriptional regulator [Acidobacteria bacterium]|nr:helix-turn-helix transcriptional regulator [Acidobacteriota bacterium]